MHREDNSVFLLYIEPKATEKLEKPMNDELYALVRFAIGRAKKGAANYSSTDKEPFFNEGDAYRGWHSTQCGKASSNQDYLLENGMITNSLAPFYVANYRSSIPDSEWKKLASLAKFYGNNPDFIKYLESEDYASDERLSKVAKDAFSKFMGK